MIKTRSSTRKQEIDLSGPQGNAFFLIGTAHNLTKQLGMSPEEANAITADMRSSDYEHLIHVFDKHFGTYVDLIKSEIVDGDDND
jgi:hypothetical protein